MKRATYYLRRAIELEAFAAIERVDMERAEISYKLNTLRAKLYREWTNSDGHPYSAEVERLKLELSDATTRHRQAIAFYNGLDFNQGVQK